MKKRKISEKQRRQGSRNFLKGRIVALQGSCKYLLSHPELYSYESRTILRAIFELESITKDWLVSPPYKEGN